jgi:mannitol-1-phosphate 5-dehydrogenase
MPRTDPSPGSRGTVVQFGAGAVGRGFLADLWTAAGYEVVFVDVDEDLVAALNKRGSYPLQLVTNDGTEEKTIAPVRAVSANDPGMVVAELARCAFAAVAVGSEVASVGTDSLAPLLLANGSAGRQEPLNILCCENDQTVPDRLRDTVLNALPVSAATLNRYKQRFSCVPTVVGRMVPLVNRRPGDDPLLIRSEPYFELPFAADQWKGELPKVPGLEPKQHFARNLARKLYVHNGGHAVLAYHGNLRGFRYIHESAADPEVVEELRGFWKEANAALAAYDVLTSDPETAARIKRYEDDLLTRFANRALGDTIARVARNPSRKLHCTERLVGVAVDVATLRGKPAVHALRAAAAALLYDDPDDADAVRMQETIREKGVGQAFQEFAGCEEDIHDFTPRVVAAYNELARRRKTGASGS